MVFTRALISLYHHYWDFKTALFVGVRYVGEWGGERKPDRENPGSYYKILCRGVFCSILFQKENDREEHGLEGIVSIMAGVEKEGCYTNSEKYTVAQNKVMTVREEEQRVLRDRQLQGRIHGTE